MSNMTHMKCYLAGGSVRDLMVEMFHGENYNHRDKSTDHDWMVLGETPASMAAYGFVQVGSDFPVFLHPETGDEYALARSEKKTGPGYSGFDCECSGVTMEEDALRRDLTVNALFKERGFNGKVHDPTGMGFQDVRDKVLRPTSPKSFEDDPVRVLRAAQHLSRFWDFVPSDSLTEAAKACVLAGEFRALTAERVQREFDKLLEGARPSRGLRWLDEVGALDVVLPELTALKGQTQPEKYHPEGDAFEHVMQAVDFASMEKYDVSVCWAVLLHDLGKGLTAQDALPAHHGHEKSGLPLVRGVCERLRLPKEYRVLAELVCEHHGRVHGVMSMRPAKVVRLVEALSGGLQSNRAGTLFRLRQCCQAFRSDALARRPNNEGQFPSYVQHRWVLEFYDFLRGFQVERPAEGEVWTPRDWKAANNRLFQKRVKELKEFKEKWT